MRSNANISFYPVRWEYAFHIPNCTFTKRQKTLQFFLQGLWFCYRVSLLQNLCRLNQSLIGGCAAVRKRGRIIVFLLFCDYHNSHRTKKYIINGNAHELKESFSKSAGITQTPTTHMSILIQNNGQKIFDSELNFLKNNCIQKTKIENRQNPRKGLK